MSSHAAFPQADLAPALPGKASRLLIRHKTQYDFDEAVELNAHVLLLRPRESPSLRLMSFEVTISPKAELFWSEDVHGNAVATAIVSEPARQLVVEAVSRLELKSQAWPIFRIDPSAMTYPFRYSDRDYTDLGPLMAQQYPDPNGQLRNWAHSFVQGHPTDTLSLLKELSSGVSTAVAYEARDSEGTQSPVATLLRARGSCRDLAVLFAEAARNLGFGARLVSGYLNTAEGDIGSSGPCGSTHAWADIYVPGAGWIAFDPTNRRMGGYNLIPVAIGRDIQTLVPVAGSFAAADTARHSLAAEVRVTDLNSAGANGVNGGRRRGNHLPAGRGGR